MIYAAHTAGRRVVAPYTHKFPIERIGKEYLPRKFTI